LSCNDGAVKKNKGIVSREILVIQLFDVVLDDGSKA
jgi:hypothetical protein